MLETMKRNKILTYAFLMAIPMTTGNIFSSCTDDFEKFNTSNIQVDPADLPFAAQCTEQMCIRDSFHVAILCMDIDYAGQSSSVTGGEGGLKEFYILYGFGVEGRWG